MLFRSLSLAALAHSNNMVMSSTEVADLTGKRHRDVMRDIRNMFSQLEIDGAQFCASQTYGNNNHREVFNLPKDLCLTLVTGYNATLRHAIIVRWEELEREASNSLLCKRMSPMPKIPQTFTEALRLALEQAETIKGRISVLYTH